ncbi:dihydrofolate reductase [Corynebacterium pacaense]|uniref:dihydrofolate reductase n=1 Tax=Corynebacterium pacaense TaxID=1816684 RepID=UPI0009B98BED|nr:dihydrofolate reductase [Corynebacterium pacaense]
MIGAIWAQGTDGVIGDGKGMPWHIPEDLTHFKEITMGQPVIMGRRTWESLPERFRPLPGRENIVLSRRSPGEWSRGARVSTSVPGAGWIMGGGELYAATINLVDRLEVTLVDAGFAAALGDRAVFAPGIPGHLSLEWESVWRRSGGYRFKFQRFERRTP